MVLPYTDRARSAITAARAHARDLGHDRIHPGHLLLGVLSVGEGVATRALAAIGVPVATLGPRIEEVLGQGGPTAGPAAPLSPGAKRALRIAGEEATGHAQLGTEHLLLGIVGAGGGVADLLARLGATPSRVRAEINRLMTTYTRGWPLIVGESGGDDLVDLRLAVLRLRVREYNEKIVDVRAHKRAAIRAGEYERAVALRHAERQLLDEKADQINRWAHSIDLGVFMDELDRLYQEIDRLHAVLRRYHIPLDSIEP
ncbi:MAG: hypothetical protein AUG44_25980 [Actinobacteria bacterium 13_1_20CM_3_71_11]|nr:MAG: hypothetical protein AUG44_25980 [Actinobacteria bacterium 13_1_20CM_3_71_11]